MARYPISMSGSTGRINLPARFDFMSTIDLRIPFGRLLAEPEVRKLVVDFSNLGYIDSTGIGTLIAWSSNCRKSGKALVLDKCDRKIVSLFKLVGVDRLFAFESAAA